MQLSQRTLNELTIDDLLECLPSSLSEPTHNQSDIDELLNSPNGSPLKQIFNQHHIDTPNPRPQCLNELDDVARRPL